MTEKQVHVHIKEYLANNIANRVRQIPKHILINIAQDMCNIRRHLKKFATKSKNFIYRPKGRLASQAYDQMIQLNEMVPKHLMPCKSLTVEYLRKIFNMVMGNIV